MPHFAAVVSVQAEEVGEDRSGELGGEIEQRGTAPGLGVDADGPQAFAEPGWGDGAAGQVPGEQPGGSGQGSDSPVAAAVGTYPAWSISANYRVGDKVLYQGLPYEAKWDNQGVSP